MTKYTMFQKFDVYWKQNNMCEHLVSQGMV